MESKFGIKILCSDADILRRRIYSFRKKNERYRHLVLRVSPHERNELWILKADIEAETKEKIREKEDLV